MFGRGITHDGLLIERLETGEWSPFDVGYKLNETLLAAIALQSQRLRHAARSNQIAGSVNRVCPKIRAIRAFPGRGTM
jgi:hypothetical protein